MMESITSGNVSSDSDLERFPVLETAAPAAISSIQCVYIFKNNDPLVLAV